MEPLQEDIDFLEHFGVKGMKWGVRQQKRLDMTKRVAEGKGSLGDRVRVAGAQSMISNIRGKNLKGAAARQVKDLENLKRRMDLGRTTTGDYLNRMGTIKLFNAGGTGDKATAKAEAKGSIKKGEMTTHAKLKVARNLTVGLLVGATVGKAIGNTVAKLV